MQPQEPDPQQITEQLDIAQQRQEQAQKAMEEALQQAKNAEQQIIENEEQLAREMAAAQAKAEESKAQLEEAKQKEKLAAQQVKQGKGGQPKIDVGFKAEDLISSLGKPPEPNYEMNMPTPEPAIDKFTAAELENQVKSTHEAVQQASQKVEQGHKEISQAKSKVEMHAQEHGSFINRFERVLKDEPEKISSQPQAPWFFIALGAAFLLLSIIAILVTGSMIWLFVALIAIAQMATGTMLKMKSQ